MNLLEAFMNSPSRKNRGQRIGEAIGEYIPPNLRPLARAIAGSSPTAVNQRAGAAFSRAVAPDRTISQRIGDVGEGLSETASIAVPMATTARLGLPATEALQEGLLGTTIAAKEAGRTIAERANQRGPVPTMYSNPVMRAPNKAELDPLGYQKTKMRGYLSDVDVNLTDTGENLPRVPMSWEDMEGKVVLPFYGDRTSRGLLVEGVNNQRFDQPVYTEGGVDFMRGPAAQADRAIWASDQGITKRLEGVAEKAAQNPEFEGRDIVGVTGSMAPDANDFATFTGAAMAELVKGAPITRAAAKKFDDVMRAVDPNFVGVLSPKLRDWATSASSEDRKSFIRLMDSNPMQAAGFPSPAEARYAVTDPTQRDMPSGMFGLGAARVDTSAPRMYNQPKDNLPRATVPHSTYNTQMAGDYLGSLEPVPQGLLFRDLYDQMEGQLTKAGKPFTESHKTYSLTRKMPAQLVTPQVVDGILEYLSRQGR